MQRIAAQNFLLLFRKPEERGGGADDENALLATTKQHLDLSSLDNSLECFLLSVLIFMKRMHNNPYTQRMERGRTGSCRGMYLRAGRAEAGRLAWEPRPHGAREPTRCTGEPLRPGHACGHLACRLHRGHRLLLLLQLLLPVQSQAGRSQDLRVQHASPKLWAS